MTKVDKELREVADGVWAYFQGDGGWGWSNAGLVTDGDVGPLLVDTLFDLRLTGEMLDTMRRAVPAAARIGTLVNTHANADHCYGNSLVQGAEVVASRACAEEMDQLPPSVLAEMVDRADELGAVGAFAKRIFGPFDFEGIELKLPTRTFEGTLELSVGDRVVRLIEVGPAHTSGDVVVHLPAEGVVFTGDILFHGGHPVVWSGPVANWMAACDVVVGLDGVDVVVPGHGPLADKAAVADFKGYFEHLTTQARQRYEAGMGAIEAAKDIDLGPYAGWSERERVVVTVHALYRDFGADTPSDEMSLFTMMAEYDG